MTDTDREQILTELNEYMYYKHKYQSEAAYYQGCMDGACKALEILGVRATWAGEWNVEDGKTDC